MSDWTEAGTWDTDSDAWDGVFEALSFGVSVNQVLTPAADNYLSLPTLAMGAGFTHAVQAEPAPSLTFAEGSGFTIAVLADADAPLSFGTQVTMPHSVEAWAAPGDTDDDWAHAGLWDDAGGGPWDQPGGTPLRVVLNTDQFGGIDIYETISLASQENVVADPAVDAIPSAQVGAVSGLTTDVLADAAPLATITAIGGVVAPAEAWAEPSDVDDDWTKAGLWDDAGGGPWDQPGGTPLRAVMGTDQWGGIDIYETIPDLAVEMWFKFDDPWNNPGTWDDMTEGNWDKFVPVSAEVEVGGQATIQVNPSVVAETLADAEASIQAGTLVEALQSNAIDSAPDIQLSVNLTDVTSGGFDADALAFLGLSLEITSLRERQQIWFPDGSSDDTWTPPAEVDSVWTSDLILSSLWDFGELFDSSWLEESEVDKTWTAQGAAGSAWNKGTQKVSPWTAQAPADKEWS